MEGTFQKNELTINHGCDENPIIAQSVVFPGANPVLSATDSDNNPVTPPNDLGEVIEGGFLEGLAHLIQDRSIFLEQDVKLSELENSIGFHGKKGFLKPHLLGVVPLKISTPTFTPNSCYSKLFIETSIADICSTKAPALQPGKVSLFIPDNGSQIGETAKANGADHGVGEPTILIITRNLEKNPYLDAEGNPNESCGNGLILRVSPSAEHLDKYLPIPGYWPTKNQSGPKPKQNK